MLIKHIVMNALNVETESQASAIRIEWLGSTEYADAWRLQRRLVAERIAAPDSADRLLLLEHPPTYTLGRNGRSVNLLLNKSQLKQNGIAFHQTDRGGDITYHGPGQLVGYPILNLKRVYAQAGLGYVRKYIHDLEELLIQLLAEFGLNGERYKKHRGVWINAQTKWLKIGAIGVRVQRGISSHGFALNVSPNLHHFTGIVPCGLPDYSVTSMSEQLGREVDMAEVVACVTAVFPHIFYPNNKQKEIG